jgi:hypothetical protein
MTTSQSLPTSSLRHDADPHLPAAAYLRYESRADGWSPGRQAAFLAHLADHGVEADAAKIVGMSLGGGYALRRQARGFAFGLGWEAALLLARRIVADRLMAAAIQGEEARWVREDGVTTYTRQNTRLSLALLDRVTPAATLPEVTAVMHRFDWFLELIDKAASAQQLWDLFFDDALTRDDAQARARVRGALLLCEETAVFEEEDAEEDDKDGYSLDDDYAGMYDDEEDEEEEDEGEESKNRSPEPVEGRGSAECSPSNRPSTSSGLRCGVEEDDENTEPPIEYKSMDGPPPKSRVGEMSAFDKRLHHADGHHQYAAIIEIPDRVGHPCRLGERPHSRENQQVGRHEGHRADTNAVAGEIAVPRHSGHCGDKQRVTSGLNSPSRIRGQIIGDYRRQQEHCDRQGLLTENRMHAFMPQKQGNRHDMSNGKGYRAPDHIQFEQAIAQGPKSHDRCDQQKFSAMMLAQRIADKQPDARHLPSNRRNFGQS